MPRRIKCLNFSKSLNAGGANLFVLEFGYVINATAKMAGGLIFFKNDFLILYIYFNRVGVFNTEFFSDFLRDNDTAKLVNVSDNASSFHFCGTFLICADFAAAVREDLAEKQKFTLFYHTENSLSIL